MRRIANLFLFLAMTALAAAGQAATHWVGSWSASQQLVEPNNALAPGDLRDATLRQIVHVSLGGNEVRLHFSNRFGNTPLRLTAVHVAKPLSPSSPKIVAESDHAVTFSGAPRVTIPPHGDYLSDPVAFTVDPLSNVAITLHLDAAPADETGHPGSRATSYLTHGDALSTPDMGNAKTVDHWYYIAGLDVASDSAARSLVILGDSITDGHGTMTNGNDRWTDALAKRLQASPTTHNIAVLNQGIGGNRLLTDGVGPSALSRFDHDVIAQPGVSYLIVLEGINDIGMLGLAENASPEAHNKLVQQMIAAYEQIIARAHIHGIKVVGATVMPFTGSKFYHPGPASEADRQAVNRWIRTSGHFDSVIDFDEITRDPQHPERLLPAYDSGDHLHPSPAGYAAMAEEVPLSFFSSPDPAPKIAFTFDDLPVHGPLPPGESRMEVILKIIAALHAASLPPTCGFVNAVHLEGQGQPERAAVLDAWRKAGNPLGNRTWSHINLDERLLEEVEQDVLRDEPVLQKLMDGEDSYWFRYPYLAEGSTPEKREAFRDFLHQHGYKVAAVTMSFGETINYYRSISHTLYDRDIACVLLMHIGAFDAEMLPRLLDLYRSNGFEFVSLPGAESDKFYRSSNDLSLPAEPDMLEEAKSARHLELPHRIDFAQELESACR